MIVIFQKIKIINNKQTYLLKLSHKKNQEVFTFYYVLVITFFQIKVFNTLQLTF